MPTVDQLSCDHKIDVSEINHRETECRRRKTWEGKGEEESDEMGTKETAEDYACANTHEQ